MQLIILEIVSKPTKDKKVTGSIKHAFTKEKSCLTNLTTFFKGMVWRMREVEDIAYIEFSKAFDVGFHTILPIKIMNNNLIKKHRIKNRWK